jgi:hypothetical protein
LEQFSHYSRTAMVDVPAVVTNPTLVQKRLLFVALVIGVACGNAPPHDLEPVAQPLAPSQAASMAATESGQSAVMAPCAPVYGQLVCATTLNPTELDAAIDVVATGSGQPGVHYVCYPGETSRWNGKLLVHFVGTNDNPGHSSGFAELACAMGFAAVAPMYKNSDQARLTCGPDPACYEAMRREILYGGDLAPDPIRVDAINSAIHRLDTIVMNVAAHESRFTPWLTIRNQIVARDFSNLVLSGHSQGSGHALLLARDHEVARVILLAGLSDRLYSGTARNAPVAWVTEWAAASKTPAAHLLGYNHEDDGVAVYRQVMANYDVLGVGSKDCAFNEAGDYPADCRRVRVVAARCSSFNAHVVAALRRFGSVSDACRLDSSLRSNQEVWRFLLTAPL